MSNTFAEISNSKNLLLSSNRSSSSFGTYAPTLVIAYAMVSALSIAASQIIVVSLTVWWIVSPEKKLVLSDTERNYISAVSFLLLCSLFSALLGVDFTRAITDSIKLGFSFLFPFVVASTLDPRCIEIDEVPKRIEHYFLAFCFGQCLAAFHSIATASYGEFDIGIPGAVTESGQLVLIIPMLVAIVLAQNSITSHLRIRSRLWCKTFTIVALSIMSAWPEMLFGQQYQFIKHFSFMVFTFGTIFLIFKPLKLGMRELSDCSARLFSSILPLVLGLLLSAMIVNLKRGPWMGILCALLVLGMVYSKRLVITCIVVFTAIILGVKPAQERLFSFASHFSIAGGRQSMWEIGVELIERFPLGLGLDNARFMRVVDPSLPESHRHMHNNILNITVETGLAGLLCYLWWLLVIFYFVYSISRSQATSIAPRKLQIMGAGLGSALLGWQISGLVEYNFGDGEIQLIAFTFVGIIIAISRHFQITYPRKI